MNILASTISWVCRQSLGLSSFVGQAADQLLSQLICGKDMGLRAKSMPCPPACQQRMSTSLQAGLQSGMLMGDLPGAQAGTKAGGAPAALLADGLQLILAPRMSSIALPGMEECSLDSCLLLRVSHSRWNSGCSAVSSSSCSSFAVSNSTTLWHTTAATANDGVGGCLPRCVSGLAGFHSTVCFAGNLN